MDINQIAEEIVMDFENGHIERIPSALESLSPLEAVGVAMTALGFYELNKDRHAFMKALTGLGVYHD